VASHHRTQRGLGDLVDGGLDVLDRDDRAHHIGDAVVGDGRDVDADVVAGDDPLRLDRHGDRPQRDAMEAIDPRHEHDQARASRPAVDASQPEQHRALVLLEDADGQRGAHQYDEQQHNDHSDDDHVLLRGLRSAEIVTAGVALVVSHEAALAPTT
jgi:hypothetical protein